MRRTIPLIGFIIIFVLSVLSVRTQTAEIKNTQASSKIVRVVDGDTIAVEENGNSYKVRLIGINTPESVDPRRPVECYGKEASDYLKKLLENKQVRLEADSTQDNLDKYGRFLRYVYADDELVNLKLIASGYALEYTYEVPYLKQYEFRQAQGLARESELGLWNPNICAPAIVTNSPSPTPMAGCVIKGNISGDNRIYHLPGCRDYDKTQINLGAGERWFCDEMEATSSGWRKAGNCI